MCTDVIQSIEKYGDVDILAASFRGLPFSRLLGSNFPMINIALLVVSMR